jgi:Flp pilus assembly protein CpaB
MEVPVRASTLFAITLASLLGLAVAVGAKASGLLNFGRKELPPPPPAAERAPDIYVLVGTRNLFAGTVIQGMDITVRPLRPEERLDYDRNREKYFPPTPQAAALRILEKNIDADKPILKEYLQDLNLPDPVKQRMVGHMRAVSVAIPKERCNGGLIQVGDWVDVVLRSRIMVGQEGQQQITRSANIAHNVRVIAKRNNLWPVLSPLPDKVPVDFILEANPYRAALIEFVADKGDVSLITLPASEQKVLEAHRNARLAQGEMSSTAYFSEPDSAEYKDEDARVSAFRNGDLTLDESDLVRIFNLKVEPPLGSTPGVNIERYVGVSRQGNVGFPPPDAGNNSRKMTAVIFQSPACTSGCSQPAVCPTCNRK